MRRAADLASQETSMGTLVEITSAFEGLASMRIAQIKDQVLQSTKFYHDLWAIYFQLKVGEEFQFGRSDKDKLKFDKQLLIIITAEGGFSGDVDFKLVQLLLEDYDPAKHDVVAIGHHGATQLNQNGVDYKQYFKLPSRDKDINVVPLLNLIRQYKSTTMYYPEYRSLMEQVVNKIDLSRAVSEKVEGTTKTDDVISEVTYIFEPSTYEVVAHLERSMIQIIVSQLIFESKLAQYASRFRAMSSAHDRADELKQDTHLQLNRAKRGLKDERLKEMINGLKKAGVGA